MNSRRHATQAGRTARKLREKVRAFPESPSNLKSSTLTRILQDRDTSSARLLALGPMASSVRPTAPRARSPLRSFSRRMSRATKRWSMTSLKCYSDLSTRTLSSLSIGSSQRYGDRTTHAAQAKAMADLLRRTSSISSLSLPLAASCLTESATRANSQKRTRLKRSSRCLQLSTTSTATRSCIEVRDGIRQGTTSLQQAS